MTDFVENPATRAPGAPTISPALLPAPPNMPVPPNGETTEQPTPPKRPSMPLIAAVAALFLLISALAIGLYLVKQQGVGEIRKLAGTGWCNADPVGTDYGSPCQVSDANHNECGGDGKQTYCGIGPDPNRDRRTTGTWHATGACCEEPTPGPGGSMSCATISTDGPHLEIKVQNDTGNDRSYQLNKCSCASKDLPCNDCEYSQPGLAAHTSRNETLDLNGACGSVQLDVSPLSGEFSPCYAWYSSGAGCTAPTATPVPTATPRPTATPTSRPTATPAPTPTVTPRPTPTLTPRPTPTLTPRPTLTSAPTLTPTPTPIAIAAGCSGVVPQMSDGFGGWTTKTDSEFAAAARPGDRVRFLCTGAKTGGNFLKAAFFINDIVHENDVIKLNDTQFTVEYTIAAAGPLKVESVLFHDSKGWVD